jgi:hypothetical protein
MLHMGSCSVTSATGVRPKGGTSTCNSQLYLDDLGIFSQTDNEITLTAWGDVFVCAWLNEELRVPDDDR